MTKSNIGKVFVGMVLMVGSARAGQWQFARESTLVPAGPEAVALGIHTLRVHAPVAATDATRSHDATSVRIEIINTDRQVVGELVDTKSTMVADRGSAPEETLVLSFQGRKVSVHYRDRAISISDGTTSVSASFDRTNVEDVERLKAFADDLRLIGSLQNAAKAAVAQSKDVEPTVQAGILGTLHWDRVVPASWASWLMNAAGGAAKDSEPVCHEEPSHAKCAGGFGASRTSGCAFAKQAANNECAEASGYCLGCCSWLGTGCDCACLLDDLACMCESCGGLCGPAANTPSPNSANAPAR